MPCGQWMVDILALVADCPLVLCANPEYLTAYGTPQVPADLAHHNALAFTGNRGPHEWRYTNTEGETGQVTLQGSFKADSGDILCRAALRHVGIVMLPIFYVAEHLEGHRLQHVLPDFATSPKREIYAVFPPNRFQSTRLRLFVDHLVATAKQLPWLT
jgi:DNA-binding transcriptional LysR family regulator